MTVSGVEITTLFVEDVLDNGSDIEVDDDNTEVIGSDSEESELDAFAPDESTMRKPSNDAPNNYSDSIQPETGINVQSGRCNRWFRFGAMFTSNQLLELMAQITGAFQERFNKAPPRKATLFHWERCAFAFGSVKDRPWSGRKKTREEA
ncbi:hypothetical protein C0J52_00713 [Blattella germanica]|nr:hypothetical protein C0J52_00713 [Blattella germanica]